MNWFVTIGGLAYNLVIIAICTGIIVSRRKKRLNQEEDFLMGGKQMGWFACAASIALTSLGGGHINGLTAQSWSTGVSTIFYCIGHGFFFLFALRFCAIWYRRMGCSTINEVFGRMFHPALIPILAGMGVGYCWMVLCIEAQGMGTVISAMTGIPNLWACVIGIVIGILYVYIAGIEEVGLVNSINAVLMYVFGIIVLIFIGYNSIIGGWQPINDTLLANNEELVHALANPTLLKGYVIGTLLVTAFGMNFIQPNIQAAAAVPNVKVLRKACTACIPMNVLFGVIVISLGLASKALVNMNMLEASDGASGVVYLILNYMPSWLQVCVIGMFLAAMLSTVAMEALALATMLNRNILCYFPRFKNMTPKREAKLSRTWIIIGGLTAAIAAVTIQAQTNSALTWGFSWFVPLFFMFLIGMFWKRSRVGALITLIVCWAFNILLTFTPLASVFGLEGNNYAIFMIVLSVVLGVVTTALDKNASVNFRSVYIKQRAEYDAKHGILRKEEPV
ncbi:MAG: sodium:solute symporter family protein [Oscillospiraceae bacterium]|nr:sodium:solute symporter family protein [Oscillospiraceae bacterium]